MLSQFLMERLYKKCRKYKGFKRALCEKKEDFCRGKESPAEKLVKISLRHVYQPLATGFEIGEQLTRVAFCKRY